MLLVAYLANAKIWRNNLMLRLLSSKGKGCKDFCKPSKSCHAGVHIIASSEYSQMNIHVPGLKFTGLLHYFVLAKLANTSRLTRVNILLFVY